MNVESTVQQLRTLRLNGMAQSYQSFADMPSHQQLDAHTLIAQLAEAEAYHRLDNRMKILLRMSKLRYAATLEQIVCSEQRNLSKEMLLVLHNDMYIKKGQNVLITGPTGVGKSYLACALGHQACCLGYKVAYLNGSYFMDRIQNSKLDGSYHRILNYYQKIDLLIFDDFGLYPLTQDIKLTLLKLLEDRYAKRPVIITSQLPIKNWFDFINDPTIADAIMDRLLAKNHRIELKGESMRKNQF
jgi:DNA replication protein DnaC